MKKTLHCLTTAMAFYAAVALNGAARADTLITSFGDDFFENALFASWAEPQTIIEYGPDSYSVTATGYGSNWVYIGEPRIQGAGNTHLRLDVTLEGPPEADGHLGPIITLVDEDGTRNNYAWFGQPLGNHILTLPISSPSWVEAPGTTPGLDLDAIDHLHLQLDPGGFGDTGAYTVRWNELSLIIIEGTPGDFDGDGIVDGHDFLLWQRDTGIGNLSDWEAAFGAGGALTNQVLAIPEPTSAGLLLLGCMSFMLRRRFLAGH